MLVETFHDGLKSPVSGGKERLRTPPALLTVLLYRLRDEKAIELGVRTGPLFFWVVLRPDTSVQVSRCLRSVCGLVVSVKVTAPARLNPPLTHPDALHGSIQKDRALERQVGGNLNLCGFALIHVNHQLGMLGCILLR